MGRSRIEDIIKGKLQGHKEALDKDELWESLGLEPERKKKRIAWWIWGIPVLLILTSAIYMSISTTSIDTTDEQLVEASADTQKINNDTAHEISINKPLESDKKDESIQYISDLKLASKKQLSETKEQDVRNKSNQKISLSLDHSAGHQSTRSIASNQHFDEVKAIAKEQNYTNRNITEESISSDETSSDQGEDSPTSTTSEVASVKGVKDLLELRSKKVGILYFNKSIAPIAAPVPKIADDISYNSSAWGIDIEYGAVNRNIQAKDTTGIGYADLRNNTEHTLDYLSVGLSYKHRLSSNFSLFGGLRYTQFNESMKYMKHDSMPIVTDAVVIFTDINGVTSTSTTEGIGTSITAKKWTYQNQMRVISIPLGIIYEQRFGKWSLDFEAGAEVRLASNFFGEIQTTDGQISANPDYLNTGIGFAYSLGIYAKYQFNEKNYFVFGPSYRKYTSSFTTEASTLKQTYQTLGGRLSFVRTF